MKGRGENSGWEDKVMEEKRGSSIHRRRLNYLPPLAGWPRLHRQQSGRLLGIVREHRPRLSTAQVFALSHLRGTSPAESPKTGTGRQSAVSAGSPWIPAGGKQAVLLLCSESEGLKTTAAAAAARREGGGGVCLFCLVFTRKWNLKSAQSCQNEGAGL